MHLVLDHFLTNRISDLMVDAASSGIVVVRYGSGEGYDGNRVKS